LVSHRNATVESGNLIVQQARVISGNYNRVFVLLDYLEGLGINIARERNSIAGTTKGFSPELPAYGMRGEALAILTLTPDLPKKEIINNTQDGILKRGTPQPQTAGGSQ
jgi:hypothetical protein